jgi:hypothetical protein
MNFSHVYVLFLSSDRAQYTAHAILALAILWRIGYKFWSLSLCNFLQFSVTSSSFVKVFSWILSYLTLSAEGICVRKVSQWSAGRWLIFQPSLCKATSAPLLFTIFILQYNSVKSADEQHRKNNIYFRIARFSSIPIDVVSFSACLNVFGVFTLCSQHWVLFVRTPEAAESAS